MSEDDPKIGTMLICVAIIIVAPIINNYSLKRQHRKLMTKLVSRIHPDNLPK